ncbi:MAG: 3-hydroxybutyryl-CoA dehydrogenase [Anaerolineaceae bacterium]|nr:3-hydroxybutyryl-CoA dehydrogenase [Anaerolineaceae bacterium]
MEADTIRTIGVIGCGLMGAGIVESCSRAGYRVIVREVNAERLENGLARVHASMAKGVSKARLAQTDMDAATQRIHGTQVFGDISDCDLVIEAAIENMDLKKSIFKDLDSICKPEVILATNTSSLCITEIAAVTSRPERVLGLHFFNPVPVMPLLEVIPGLLTSAETLAIGRKFGEILGKTVVVTKDRPGFIVNLLLIPFLLDTVGWLDAGLATKEDFDTAVRLGLNHPMGPLSLCDLIGLDTVLNIADVLYEELHDPRYVAPTLLRRMVKAGLLGRKVGQGFYTY